VPGITGKETHLYSHSSILYIVIDIFASQILVPVYQNAPRRTRGTSKHVQQLKLQNFFSYSIRISHYFPRVRKVIFVHTARVFRESD